MFGNRGRSSQTHARHGAPADRPTLWASVRTVTVTGRKLKLLQIRLTYVGSFLGISSRRVALSFDQLRMEGDRITATTITEEQAKDIPEYQGQR
jgi:hypothetical protein